MKTILKKERRLFPDALVLKWLHTRITFFSTAALPVLVDLDRFYLPVAIIAVWVVTTWSLVESFPCLGGSCCPHLQGRRDTARKNHEAKNSTLLRIVDRDLSVYTTPDHRKQRFSLSLWAKFLQDARAEHKSAEFLLVLDCDNPWWLPYLQCTCTLATETKAAYSLHCVFLFVRIYRAWQMDAVPTFLD